MRVLAAMDKFKGTATSAELGGAVVAAARGCGADAVAVLVSDGGEGLLDVYGGANRTSTVTGPSGAPVAASWRLDGTTAVIESARACGLVLAGGATGNDPVAATSAGVGELVSAAAMAGARRIVVGIGGSACTDGGLPAIDAIGEDVLTALDRGAVELVVCSDVTTRYEDAAAQFAPQKGASAGQVIVLRDRLHVARAALHRRFGRDVGELVGSGAAGGLAGGLAAIGGRLRSGFDVVAEHVSLADAMASSDLVITGEGRLDASSFVGKVVGGVASIATREPVRLVAVVGSIADDVAAPVEVRSLVDRFGARRAHDDVLGCVADVVRDIVRDVVHDD